MSANFLNILFNTLWNNLSFDTCPTGMVRVGKHCYLFINKFNTFTEASETCTSHGLQLVTVRGMSEISEFLKSRQNNLCGDRNIFWLNKDKNNIIHEREEHFNFTIKRYNKRNSFWYYINCKEKVIFSSYDDCDIVILGTGASVDILVSSDQVCSSATNMMADTGVATVCQQKIVPHCKSDWTMMGDSCYKSGLTL